MKLSQGPDQNAAVQDFVAETKIVVASSNQNTINGNSATTIIGDITQEAQQQGQQAQSIRVKASFISYGGLVYMLAGLADVSDFNRYQRDIEYTLGSFGRLTDQRKLNKRPETIKIVSNPRSQSLGQALIAAGVPQARVNELAILNGMEVNQTIAAGTLFKALGGDIRPQK